MRSALEHLLLPAECLLCRRLLSFRLSRRLVCDVCRYRWRAVVPPWCARCGQPGPHFGACRICEHWPPAFLQARSAVWLDAGARDAVHALKYGGWAGLADELADAVARHVPAPGRGAVLVPVPLGARRLRTRGYNQSERLAVALGRRWRVAVRNDILVRARETPSQTALTPEARVANVAGAFQLRIANCGLRNHAADVQSAICNPQSAIVLVDDVFTTGATLVECARVLAGARWDRVTAVTFGRAVIPDFT